MKKESCNYWETKLGGEIDWNACFTKTENTRNETKMVSDSVLKEMGITQSVLCYFRKLERDSFQHCMWGCEHMKSFWN